MRKARDVHSGGETARLGPREQRPPDPQCLGCAWRRLPLSSLHGAGPSLFARQPSALQIVPGTVGSRDLPRALDLQVTTKTALQMPGRCQGKPILSQGTVGRAGGGPASLGGGASVLQAQSLCWLPPGSPPQPLFSLGRTGQQARGEWPLVRPAPRDHRADGSQALNKQSDSGCR